MLLLDQNHKRSTLCRLRKQEENWDQQQRRRCEREAQLLCWIFFEASLREAEEAPF